MKRLAYAQKPGWFDLSKLALPVKKFNTYAKLQEFCQLYQDTRDYQKQYNAGQYDRLKELCAEMQMGLILHYGALEAEA